MSMAYIKAIKDMYDGAKTLKIVRGESKHLPIMMGLHQGSTLGPFLIVLVMDELTRHIQGEVLLCMLFAHDIVLMTRRVVELTVGWKFGG